MRRTTFRMLALAVAAGAMVAIAAAPATAGGGKRGGSAGADKQGLIQAAATFIGVTVAEVNAAKQAGQTLGQLATSKGKTVQGLTDALVAAGTASIDQALAAGSITADQAAARKTALPAQVTALITSTRAGGCGAKSGSSSKSSSVSFRRR